MPAEDAHECPCNNSVLQPTIAVDILYMRCSYTTWDTDSAARKNLHLILQVFFLHQWIYRDGCADQQLDGLWKQAGHDANWHFLPCARLQYDFVFLMVLIWRWVIVVPPCPLSVQGFRVILIWRDRPQEIWSLKLLLWLGLLQVNQELESWFGNRIRYIVSDINLQRKGGEKNETNQCNLLDPSIL